MNSKLFFLFFSLLVFLSACQQNESANTDDVVSSDVPVADFVVENDSTTPEYIENTDNSSEQLQANRKTDSNEDTQEIASTKEQISKEISTAADLELEMNNKVNKNVNPDNYNGISEIKNESHILVIPVYSDADKAKYYVHFATNVHKYSKTDLAKIFKDTQEVYVIQNQGLFQYCLGQFELEDAANNFKLEVDKKFGFKDSQVVNFEEAW